MASQFAFCTPQFLEWREFEGDVEVVEATEFRGNDVWHLRFSDESGIDVERYFAINDPEIDNAAKAREAVEFANREHGLTRKLIED